MSEAEEDPPEVEASLAEKFAPKVSVEFIGNLEKLNHLKKTLHVPEPGWLGKSDQLTEQFRAQQFALADITRDLAGERDEAHERLVSLANTVGAEKREEVEREIRGLELQQQLVETQRAMLDQQIQQSVDAAHDRRIQYAVLVLAIVGITTTIVVSVAVATQSVWWALLAGVGASLVDAALAVVIVRGRKTNELGA